MRTLIVDDELLGRMLLGKMMAAYGNCDVAVNGKEAVEAYSISCLENDPHRIIFLDIVMPTMDGHETVTAIRAFEAEKGIVGPKQVKIIMMTAKSDSKSVIGSFREGCDGYIVKPVTRDKILDQLRKLSIPLISL